MPYNEVSRFELDNYRSIYWEGIEIHKRHDYIVDFIKSEIGEQYAHLLCLPKIRNNQVAWLSNIVSTNNTTLDQLPESEQAAIETHLDRMIAPVEALISQLRNDANPQRQSIAELLELAYDIPDNSYVFVDNVTKNVCFAGWGFTPNQTGNKKGIGLKRSKKNESNLPPPAAASLTIPPNNPQENEVSPPQETPIETASNDENTLNTEASEPTENPENLSAANARTPAEEKKKRNLLPWILGALLLAALLFILYLLFFDNKDDEQANNDSPREEEREKQYQDILPPQPGVLPPLDTTKIIIDDDDPLGRTIVSNRLNIYLTKGADVKAFSKVLKDKYPDPDIKIVYYTAAANRLMIECPPDQRTTLSKDLKENFKQVEFVMDETIFQQQKLSSPFNDPGFSELRKAWYFEKIQTYEAWEITKGKPDVTIAILDNGFDPKHEEFENRFKRSWNIPMNQSQLNTGMIGMIHGTHVAGIAGARADNNDGVAGIAPECKILPVQIGNPVGMMTTSSIVDGLFYALNNDADVVNLSLGSSFMTKLQGLDRAKQEQLAKTLYPEQEAFWTGLFKLFHDKGVVVVQASGNSNVLSSLDPMQRNPYTIIVNASDERNRKANFSNYGGNSSKLTAPGAQIYNAIPGNQYKYLDGTSMAAPIVSAAVALLKSKNPNITPEQCFQTLHDTGLDIGPDVGRLIQLGKALGAEIKENPCDEEIERLKEEIEQLKDLIQNPDSNDVGLVIPDDPEDLSFAEGYWKSTTDLFNTSEKEPVELYFKFDKNGGGELTILERDGTKCAAPVAVKLSSGKMDMRQTTKAKCDDGHGYYPYMFVCESQNGAEAQCKATSQAGGNTVNFRLKKVNVIK